MPGTQKKYSIGYLDPIPQKRARTRVCKKYCDPRYLQAKQTRKRKYYVCSPTEKSTKINNSILTKIQNTFNPYRLPKTLCEEKSEKYRQDFYRTDHKNISTLKRCNKKYKCN